MGQVGYSEPVVRPKYAAPATIQQTSLLGLLPDFRQIGKAQERLLFVAESPEKADLPLWVAGDASLVGRPCVAIVGTRKVSPAGAARTRRLARELAEAGVVVVSGLAEGVDWNAHTAAIEAGGRTIAVIGTPLDRAYPAAHKSLQESIHRDHLLVSRFPPGSRVFKSNFPMRNRLMAALSDATVIVEAGETSGALHQAAECHRLGRWLFIAKSLIENKALTWPGRFAENPMTSVLTSTEDVLRRIRR